MVFFLKKTAFQKNLLSTHKVQQELWPHPDSVTGLKSPTWVAEASDFTSYGLSQFLTEWADTKHSY